MAIVEAELDAFTGQFVNDLGSTLHAATVVIGDKPGLHKAPDANGPSSSEDLAQRTGTAERYVREWLRGQAARGYVPYDPASGKYSLSEVQTIEGSWPTGAGSRWRMRPHSPEQGMTWWPSSTASTTRVTPWVPRSTSAGRQPPTAAGFTSFRRAAQTPFNIVRQARP